MVISRNSYCTWTVTVTSYNRWTWSVNIWPNTATTRNEWTKSKPVWRPQIPDGTACISRVPNGRRNYKLPSWRYLSFWSSPISFWLWRITFKLINARVVGTVSIIICLFLEITRLKRNIKYKYIGFVRFEWTLLICNENCLQNKLPTLYVYPYM